MTAKKESDSGEKLTVKQFKDKSQNWWCSYYHYTILNGELILAAGGAETEEIRNHMLKYLKTKGINVKNRL